MQPKTKPPENIMSKSKAPSGNRPAKLAPPSGKATKHVPFKEAFELIDTDRDGTISNNDLMMFFSKFNMSVSAKEAQGLLDDMRASKGCPWEGFQSLINDNLNRLEKLMAVFETVDTNKDGKVNSPDLVAFLDRLGCSIVPDIASQVIPSEVDFDGFSKRVAQALGRPIKTRNND